MAKAKTKPAGTRPTGSGAKTTRTASQGTANAGVDPAERVQSLEEQSRAKVSGGKFKTYTAKGKTQAYVVTADEGETIITSRGAEHARKGDYVVLNESTPGQTSHAVVDKETFEAAHNV